MVTVSPVDVQAFVAEAGIDYPTTPQQKAMLLPLVQEWKADKAAALQESRGPSAVQVGLGAAAATGLGLAGWAAFNHFKKQGLSDEVAAAAAVQAGSELKSPVEIPVARQDYSPATGTRVVVQQDGDPAAGHRRRLGKSRGGHLYDNAALAGANRSGTLQARARGEYNLKSPWNDPELGPQMAAADTPELRDTLLRRLSAQDPDRAVLVAQAFADRLNPMLPVALVDTADKLPPAGKTKDGTQFRIKDTNEVVVSNGNKWQSASPAGVRARMAPTGKDAYGTTTAEEEMQAGRALQQSRRTSGKMFQPGYQPEKLLIDDQGELLGDPENGSYRLGNAEHRQLAERQLAEQRAQTAAQLEASGMHEQAARLRAKGGQIGETNTAVQAPTPTSGPKLLRNADGKVITDKGGAPIAMFRQVLRNGTVVERPGNNLIPGLKATPITLVDNAVARDHSSGGAQIAFSDREDALTKGMMEALPASRTSRSGREGFDATSGHLPSGPGSTYWGDAETGEPVRLIPQSTGQRIVAGNDGKRTTVNIAAPSVVAGMFVETPKRVFVPDPGGKSKTVWDPATETYRQQPLGQYQRVLDGDKQPVYERRPATVQDLIDYTPGNDSYDAPIYRGKTTREMLGANDAAHFDYTRALDDAGSAGSYTALLDDGTVGRIERAAVFQPGFILKEPKDAYSRALMAAEELDNLGGMPANVYARYGVDQALVDQARAHVEGSWSPAAPRTSLAVDAQSRPVGGHTSKDWLTQVLSGMAVTPRPDGWTLEKLEKGATREDSAALAKGWLNANPGIAEVLSSNLDGVPVVEQLNLVQEALGNAAADFPRAVAWAEQAQPELAARAKLGGAGSFGFDQFSKSYVRKALLGAVAELKSAGGDSAANVVVPAAVSELLAVEARSANPQQPDLAAAVDRRIAGATSPIEALWKLDGILSDAASTSLDESYTNGSRLAEGFFEAASPGDGSRVGALKQRLGALTSSAYNPDRPPAPGEPVASRLPIAIRFGSNLSGAEGGVINRSDTQTPQQVVRRAVHGGGVAVSKDPAQIDPQFARTSKRQMSWLQSKTGGAGRSFAVNKILDNEAKALLGQDKALAQQQQRGEITTAELKQGRAAINARLAEIRDQQGLLDTTRAGNELLLMDSNRQAQTEDGAMGLGYVLDFGADGRIHTLPDLGGATVSYEQVFEKPIRENEEAFDRATLEDSRRDEGETVRELLPSRVDDPLRQAVDPYAPMSDAEAAPLLERLRNQRLDQQLQQEAAAGLSRKEAIKQALIHELQRDAQPAAAAPQWVPGSATPTPPAAPPAVLQPPAATPGPSRPYRPIPSAAAAAPQVTGYSAQELSDARARHIMSYIESAATPDFDKRGRQTRGWIGGDSWHGGARLAGRADRNVGAYVPPSDAMTALLAGAARRRGMV